MKKVITILMILILLLSLTLIASAEEIGQSDKEEFKAYIENKIIPVIAGVIASVVALLGSLKSLLSALKNLNTAKDDFKETTARMSERADNDSKALNIAYDAIKESVKNVPELIECVKTQDEKIEKIEETIVVAVEILSLAYSANSELVKTGKAKEMNRLLNKLNINKGVAENESV